VSVALVGLCHGLTFYPWNGSKNSSEFAVHYQWRREPWQRMMNLMLVDLSTSTVFCTCGFPSLEEKMVNGKIHRNRVI